MRRHINGIDLAYDDSGTGVPIVWLHAYPLHRGMWLPQIRGLAGRARHIVVDLRGFGESDAPEGAYTMDEYADDVRLLLDAVGVEKMILAGLSMGGYIALAFARNHPRHVQGLILADTRAGADTPEAAQTRRENATRAVQEGVATVVEPLVVKLLSESTRRDQPVLVERVRNMMFAARPNGVAGALLAMASRRDSTPELGDIDVPTLIVVGNEDVITPPSESKAMAAAIPHSRLVSIPDAGHLSSVERPDAFNAAVDEFLRNWGGA